LRDDLAVLQLQKRGEEGAHLRPGLDGKSRVPVQAISSATVSPLDSSFLIS
jgi:hypothetical protein